MADQAEEALGRQDGCRGPDGILREVTLEAEVLVLGIRQAVVGQSDRDSFFIDRSQRSPGRWLYPERPGFDRRWQA